MTAMLEGAGLGMIVLPGWNAFSLALRLSPLVDAKESFVRTGPPCVFHPMDFLAQRDALLWGPRTVSC
jgi:hypothetical protein